MPRTYRRQPGIREIANLALMGKNQVFMSAVLRAHWYSNRWFWEVGAPKLDLMFGGHGYMHW